MFCRVEYQGHPDFPAEYAVKGFRLQRGKPVDVPAEIAGYLIGALGKAVIKVISGEARPFVPARSPTVKRAARLAAEAAEAFPVDPRLALSQVAPLSEVAQNALKTERAALLVRKGDLDAELPQLAVVARLLGREKLVEACLERCEVVTGERQPEREPPPEGEQPEKAE